ncbi:MAG: hypothetical protein HY788_08555 [Deltaproteobacteria bacterium]|nr:hypothetical protein [Deltaproteobacteria bacterium]
MQGIQNMAASIAGAVISNLGETVTFARPAGVYDPTTGEVDEDPETWTEKIWFKDYSQFERQAGQGIIQARDRKALYRGASSHRPQPGDEIERSDETKWRVEAANQDPSMGFCVLQVRPL